MCIICPLILPYYAAELILMIFIVILLGYYLFSYFLASAINSDSDRRFFYFLGPVFISISNDRDFFWSIFVLQVFLKNFIFQ